AITIATNMAGRGTDIKLGAGVKQCKVCGIQGREASFAQQVEVADLQQAEVKQRGCYDDPPCGLVIIGTERHESRRIDRQLRGRSGRQGDPGQSVFYLSLEDDLMRLFGSERIGKLSGGWEENEPISHPWVTSAIGTAQKRVELQNFQSRKKLLEYDDVMNQQREVIYSLRLFALEGGEELKGEAQRMTAAAVAHLADELTGAAKDTVEWDRGLIDTEYLQRFLLSVPDVGDPAKIRTRDDLVHAAQDAVKKAFEGKVAYLKDLEAKANAPRLPDQVLAHTMLTVIDEKWKDHLYDLDQLKTGIVYRQWGQKDPLIEYKQEAYSMFVDLMNDLRATFTERWFKIQVQFGPPPGQGRGPAPRTLTGPAGGAPRRAPATVASKPAADGMIAPDGPPGAPLPPPGRAPAAGAAANPYAGVGRNDPCPCGSGKKFKKCHGAGA
ncbi:MAG TPA: SEC-C metal-binding domain-containing protein, partial [Gemmatimonadales bacterium]|nr:SEC-C metal-binding domain-containing protein [Gemmatimonadales bacterium]